MKKAFRFIVWLLALPLVCVWWVVLYIRNVTAYFVYRAYRQAQYEKILKAHGPIAASLFNAQTLVRLSKFTRNGR